MSSTTRTYEAVEPRPVRDRNGRVTYSAGYRRVGGTRVSAWCAHRHTTPEAATGCADRLARWASPAVYRITFQDGATADHDRGTILQALQEVGLRYGDLVGHVDDLDAGHTLHTEAGVRITRMPW